MIRRTLACRLRRACALLLCCALPVPLAACGPRAAVGSGSPAITGQTVSVYSDGTEASQKVTVAITFDRPVAVGRSVDGQLAVTLNGKEPDKQTMRWTAAADKADNHRLLFTLSALPTVTDPQKGRFFGLYEGRLVIAAKDKNGAVAAVTDAGGRYVAKWTAVRVQIPSGVALTQVSADKGSASAPARTSVRVASLGVVRAMTWVQLLENGQPAMPKNYKRGSFSYTNDGSIPIHDHELFQMRAEDYASEIAAGLSTYFGKGTPTEGRFTFASQGDTVTVTASAPQDGQKLSLLIFNHLEP